MEKSKKMRIIFLLTIGLGVVGFMLSRGTFEVVPPEQRVVGLHSGGVAVYGYGDGKMVRNLTWDKVALMTEKKGFDSERNGGIRFLRLYKKSQVNDLNSDHYIVALSYDENVEKRNKIDPPELGKKLLSTEEYDDLKKRIIEGAGLAFDEKESHSDLQKTWKGGFKEVAPPSWEKNFQYMVPSEKG